MSKETEKDIQDAITDIVNGAAPASSSATGTPGMAALD